MRWLLLLLALPAQALPLVDRLYEAAEPGTWCTPRGALATLLGESPACALDFDACDLALTAARGEPVPDEQVALLADLVARADGQWAARCPGDGPHFLFQTGIKGLAAVGAHVHVDRLLALTAPEELGIIGENARRLVAEALYWLGDKAGAPGLTRLVAHPGGNPDFKATALLGLAALGDAGAVGFCQVPPDDARVAVACLHYVATLRPEGALALIEAGAAEHPEAAARALGTLGDAAAVPLLKRLAAGAELPVRLAAQVSLVELGDDTYVGALTAALQAPEKLFKERLERAKKRPKRVKKAKPRRGRRRPPPPPKPPSPKAMAALMKEVAALDLAVRVAMECGRLTRPHERIDHALRVAARVVNDQRPQAHTAALLALAQRGDPQAIQQVAALLVASVDPIRTQLLEGVGALHLEPWLPSLRRGRGVVAHPALLPALATLADDAETHAQRSLALRAGRNVRRVTKPPP